MAGGKETPRQKMIGMMYLVLTALLALNVSKSILDAFVAIEENIQEANLTELFRGNEKSAEITETSLDTSNLPRAKKAKRLEKTVNQIDKITAERIHFIDALKIQLLDECGEDISTVGNPTSILLEKFDAATKILKPVRMKLEQVQGKDRYDEVMQIMIGGDIKKPTGKGMELWSNFNSFRTELTEIIASSQLRVSDDGKIIQDKRYSFKAPVVNTFSDQKDLTQKLSNALKSVHPDDQAQLLDIYTSLTKQEYATVHDVKDVHWIGKTFDHAPIVAAIASLSSLQKDILSARAKAVALIRGRIGGGEYSFNKIIPLAYGPEVVNANEEFTVEVLMAAYDSDKQPEVTLNGEVITEVRDGKGFVKVQATGSEMELKGTVSVRNKAGVRKTLDWTKRVRVMKPAGSIEIPGYNILYNSYDNIVDPTASGFPETVLTGTNVNIRKSNGKYVVIPSSGVKTASLTVSGRTADGNLVTLKRMEYKVANLPKPDLYWGASVAGTDASVFNTALNAKYGPEIPLNAEFTIEKWICQVDKASGPPRIGRGNNLQSARDYLSVAPKGSWVTIVCDVRPKGGGVLMKVTGAFRIQ